MRYPSLAGTAALALLVAAPATAQMSTVSRPLSQTTATCDQKTPLGKLCACRAEAECETVARHLTRLVVEGDSEKLRNYAQEVVHTLARVQALAADMGNVKRNYYRLVWQGTDVDGKPKAFQTLVHEGMRTDQTPRLNGIGTATRQRLVDVLVADDENTVLHSVYVSTPVANPLLEQVPDVLKKVDFLGFVATVRDRVNFVNDQAPPSAPMKVALYGPQLPYRRSDIQVADAIIVPTTAASFVQSSEELAVQVGRREARTSTCAAQLVAAYRQTIAAVATGPECGPRGEAGAAKTCAKALEQALDEAYQKGVSNCPREPSGGAQDPVLIVDDKFRALVATYGQKVARNDSKLANVPDTRFSFGVMTAVIVGSPTVGATRVKVDWSKATAKLTTAVKSGPAINTTRRPKRSMRKPEGIVPARLPSRNAVITPLATPKLTVKDLASAGTAGRATPAPTAKTSAGK